MPPGIEIAFGSNACPRLIGSVNVPLAICDVATSNVCCGSLTLVRMAVSAASCCCAAQKTVPSDAGGVQVLGASVPPDTESSTRKLSAPVTGSKSSYSAESPLNCPGHPPLSVRNSSRDGRTTCVIWLSDWRNVSTEPRVEPSEATWFDVTNPSLPSALTPKPDATEPPSDGRTPSMLIALTPLASPTTLPCRVAITRRTWF